MIERIEQERDRPAIPKAVFIGLIAMVLFTLGGLWANRILDKQERELQPHGPLPTPAAIGSREIGMVNQFIFEDALEIERAQHEQRRYLESYGWVDKEQAVAHIPIDRAMEQIAEEAAP